MTTKANSRALLCCGAALLAVFVGMAFRLQRAPSVWEWLGWWTAAWTLLVLAWRCGRESDDAPILIPLWVVAMALRVVGFCATPVFEDDWYRYLWDGRQSATTGNPYDVAPRAHFADESVPDEFQAILSNINHPDVPTIYGPVCQFAFALSYWIAPAQLWPLKLLLIGADLTALFLLLKLAPPRNALLYAWCPLVIQETSFNAHVEILGVALIVASLWAQKHQRIVLTGIFCACAVAARIHAVLVIPFLLWPLNRRSIAAFFTMLAVLYAPFWLQGSAADLAGLRAFLGEWEFNSSLFALAKALAGWRGAKLACNGLFLLVAFAIFAHFTRGPKETTNDTNRTSALALLVLAAFFAVSAVVNPWYLLWLAPFVALRPSFTTCAAMAAVSLSYIHGGTVDAVGLLPYEHPKWLRPLEYGLILAAACFEWRRNLVAAKWKTH